MIRSPSRITPILILLLSCCFAKDSTAQSSKKWKLVWQDEFNYTGLPDSAKWSYETGNSGWGNHELEYYTARRPENARVENGMLIIEARKEDYRHAHYTSARLVTRGKAEWQYGRIEVRAKLPRGRGTWPAIWMLNSKTPMVWPDDGEIDIMEHVGYDPGKIHGSIHDKTYNWVKGTQKTAILDVPDAMDAFHVYAMEWTPEKMDLYIDKHKYLSFRNEHKTYAEWPFDHRSFLLLNVAVGGDWGGRKGVDDSIFPQKMLVDYVRVYQEK